MPSVKHSRNTEDGMSHGNLHVASTAFGAARRDLSGARGKEGNMKQRVLTGRRGHWVVSSSGISSD